MSDSLAPSGSAAWPPLLPDEWDDTRDTLHMWLQIAGKLKVELAPFQNQLWHTALALTSRGLTTGPLPYGSGVFQVDFDFVDHTLTIWTSVGDERNMPLQPCSVAAFYQELFAALSALGIDVQINPIPQEVPNPIACDINTTYASYDPDAVNRWWRILTASATVMWKHRSYFTGKASPVHFFWGAFDLTATRHNGVPHQVPPGSGYIYRVAENEANWAAGFWPGRGAVGYPAYYAYMIPKPEGLENAAVEPDAAFWSEDLGEFILPYEAVRTADDPEAALMRFLESTYAVSADLAGWDRASLEIATIPRPR